MHRGSPTAITEHMHLELYRRFVDLRAAADAVGQLMPYNWTAMPDRLNAAWMVYSAMLDDFARELANSINAFTLNVRRLSAWETLMTSLGEEEKAEALHEFIEPIATLCLLTPYAIRSRLLFATAHLCHQVNLVRETDWPEASLPVDDKIWMDSADRQGARWRKYNRLKTRIEAIGGKRLGQATANFRNAFAHRFSPRVGTGITNFATRHFDPAAGKACYSFGGTEPLDLKELTALLVAELDRCYAAFAAFQALVGDQAAYVTEKNSEMLATIDRDPAAGPGVETGSA
jgi:hypothetical protein